MASSTQTRTVHTLGWNALFDDDLIRNGLWDREGSWGSPEAVLGEFENWDYATVTGEWIDRAKKKLGKFGISWEPYADEVAWPDTLSEEDAEAVWQDIIDGFDEWIDQVVAEVRAGKDQSLEAGVRPEDAPGGLWVTRSTTN
jgi:hypothetical protein